MKLKCPTNPDGSSLGNASFNGREYVAVNGFVDVPDAVVPQILHHGYRHPNQDELAVLEAEDDARAADPTQMTRAELVTYLRAAGQLPPGRPTTDELRDLVTSLVTGVPVESEEQDEPKGTEGDK